MIFGVAESPGHFLTADDWGLREIFADRRQNAGIVEGEVTRSGCANSVEKTGAK